MYIYAPLLDEASDASVGVCNWLLHSSDMRMVAYGRGSRFFFVPF